MTDVLQTIAENTAASANKFMEEPVGKVMTRRWLERDKPAQPEENRTSEEIIAHIKKKIASL